MPSKRRAAPRDSHCATRTGVHLRAVVWVRRNRGQRTLFAAFNWLAGSLNLRPATACAANEKVLVMLSHVYFEIKYTCNIIKTETDGSTRRGAAKKTQVMCVCTSLVFVLCLCKLLMRTLAKYTQAQANAH